MKTRLVIFAAAITSTMSFAQQPGMPLPLVSTSGSAQIRVVPDLADLSFDVEVRNLDLTQARKQQAERAAKLMAVLRAAGVTETEKIRFYRVSQNISCTLHEVKKVPDVTAEAVVAGATGVREVSLRSSELRKYRDEARARAMRAAKEKAVALAAELGAKVGRPHTISENAYYEARLGSNSFNNGNIQVAVGGDEPGDGTTPTFAPGTISISASVNVSFLLE